MAGEKFSVYNSPMGGAPPAPPPARPSPINFKYDGLLNKNYMTATTKLEDAIRMEVTPPTPEGESLMKMMRAFLSGLFPKWLIPSPSSPAVKAKPSTLPRPIQISPPSDKGIIKAFQSAAATAQKGVEQLVKITLIPFQLAAKVTMAVISFSIKTGEVIAHAFQVAIANPLEAVWNSFTHFVETKINNPLQKGYERIEASIQRVFSRLEKEGERILSLLTPPVEAVKKQIEKYGHKVAEKAYAIAEPIGRKAEEVVKTVSRQLERLGPPLKHAAKAIQTTVVSAVQIIPTASLATGLIRFTRPFTSAGKTVSKVGFSFGKSFLKSGQKAFSFVQEKVVRGVAAIGSYIESFLRKLFKLVLRLLKIATALGYSLLKLFLTLPKQLFKGIKAVYRLLGSLTLWVRKQVVS